MDKAIDIKAKVEEISKKLSGDKTLAADFRKEPIKTLEKLTGKDLPDEKVQQLLAGVKAKLGNGELGEKIDAAKDKLEDKLEASKLGDKLDAAKDKLEDKIDAARKKK